MSDIRQEPKLSEKLRYWRAERPDEWTMDEFISDSERLEAAHKAQQAEIERLTKLITKSLGLLDVALCPSCDNSGAYYDNYGEVTQCQWCHEVNEIKSALEGNQ